MNKDIFVVLYYHKNSITHISAHSGDDYEYVQYLLRTYRHRYVNEPHVSDLYHGRPLEPTWEESAMAPHWDSVDRMVVYETLLHEMDETDDDDDDDGNDDSETES